MGSIYKNWEPSAPSGPKSGKKAEWSTPSVLGRWEVGEPGSWEREWERERQGSAAAGGGDGGAGEARVPGQARRAGGAIRRWGISFLRLCLILMPVCTAVCSVVLGALHFGGNPWSLLRRNGIGGLWPSIRCVCIGLCFTCLNSWTVTCRPPQQQLFLFWDGIFLSALEWAILRNCSCSITASLLRSDSWLISMFFFGLFWGLFGATLGASVFSSDIKISFWQRFGTNLAIDEYFWQVSVTSSCVDLCLLKGPTKLFVSNGSWGPILWVPLGCFSTWCCHEKKRMM
jgi:hypothetical protein